MSSINRDIFSGVIFTSISKYSGLIIGLIISSILARLLNPEEFGIVAISMVFISFFNLMGTMGIGAAIIQNDSLTTNDIKSIFTFSIVIAISISLLFFLSSRIIADYYESPELNAICKMLSFCIFFNIIVTVPQSLLYKKLRFKILAILTIITQIFAGIVGVFLAYQGFSYYSLVAKSIISSFLMFLLVVYINPIKIGLISSNSIFKIFKFSSNQFLFNFINYFSRNLDNILIGKYLGKSSLGFYEKSYYLMTLPIGNLTNVITPVLHPVLSKFQNEPLVIYSQYKSICSFLALIGFPLSIFLYFSAEELILLIYGNQWIESIPVFKMLTLSVGIQIILSSTGSIFQASDRTDLLFLSGLFSAVVTVSAICMGILYYQNLVSIGVCLLIAFSFNFIQAFYILIYKVLGQSLLDFFKIFIYPIFVSIFVFFAFQNLSSFFIYSILVNFLYKLFVFLAIVLSSFLISKSKREFLFRIFLVKKN